MTIYLPIQLTDWKEVYTHVLGGRAHFSIVSKKTNTHFTYRIVRSPKYKWLFAVWVKDDKKYKYVGTWNGKTLKFYWNPKKSIPRSWKRYQGFVWVWRHVVNRQMPTETFVYRDERCRACGKRLTNPKSIKLGIGPECIKRR